MPEAALVHFRPKQITRLRREPIMQTDSSRKNDCECHATQWLLPAIRREHLHLTLPGSEDGLTSNGPYIKLL